MTNQEYITGIATLISDYRIVDYIFTSLYQAAQGTERLLKIIVELIVYINKNDEKQKTDDLLYGHNHIALVDYIAMKGIIKFDSSCRNLLQVLADFYKDARYHASVDAGHFCKLCLSEFLFFSLGNNGVCHFGNG